LSATYGQGMLVRIAADCRDKGWTVEQTYEYLMIIRHKIQHCIIPNDLFYLNKGGRMTAFAAGVGTVLNIKPLLVFDEAGKLKLMEKCRGTKKAFLKTIDCLNKTLIDENHNLITIVHTNNQKGAQELADMIQTRLNITPDIKIMGPVIGSHVGPGSVSCTWVSTSTREDLFKIFKS
jgi:DegV family protein with EDD domain